MGWTMTRSCPRSRRPRATSNVLQPLPPQPGGNESVAIRIRTIVVSCLPRRRGRRRVMAPDLRLVMAASSRSQCAAQLKWSTTRARAAAPSRSRRRRIRQRLDARRPGSRGSGIVEDALATVCGRSRAADQSPAPPRAGPPPCTRRSSAATSRSRSTAPGVRRHRTAPRRCAPRPSAAGIRVVRDRAGEGDAATGRSHRLCTRGSSGPSPISTASTSLTAALAQDTEGRDQVMCAVPAAKRPGEHGPRCVLRGASNGGASGTSGRNRDRIGSPFELARSAIGPRMRGGWPALGVTIRSASAALPVAPSPERLDEQRAIEPLLRRTGIVDHRRVHLEHRHRTDGTRRTQTLSAEVVVALDDDIRPQPLARSPRRGPHGAAAVGGGRAGPSARASVTRPSGNGPEPGAARTCTSWPRAASPSATDSTCTEPPCVPGTD